MPTNEQQRRKRQRRRERRRDDAAKLEATWAVLMAVPEGVRTAEGGFAPMAAGYRSAIDEQIAAFVECVEEYSDGACRVQVTTVEPAGGPVESVLPGWGDWVRWEECRDWLDSAGVAHRGFDAVVLWVPGNDPQHPNPASGLTSVVREPGLGGGYSYCRVGLDFYPEGLKSGHMVLHEWLHQATHWFREDHGATVANIDRWEVDYVHRDGRPFRTDDGQEDWYRSLMTGDVNPRGSFEAAGIGPEVWALGTPRSGG